MDLRQNFGGFLETAVSILDEIIAGEDLLVYTKGRKYTDEQYHARKKGIFEQGKIAVLIDEGSASASEILAGAVQDLDRGLVIGRRSFGKGLVQNQIQLSDGSALRLTVAKYFTPSGRNIQKPYKNVDYNAEVYERFKKGEFFSAHQLSDSIQKPDTGETKVYYTKNKRIVKASGGITPDYFIPLDTTNSFQNIQEIRSELDDFITENKDFIQSKIASVQGCVALNESIHKKDLFYNEFVAHLKKRNTLPVIKLINKQKLKELISIAISKRFYSEECYQHSIIYFDNFVNFTQKALQKKLPYVSKK